MKRGEAFLGGWVWEEREPLKRGWVKRVKIKLGGLGTLHGGLLEAKIGKYNMA